jgi:hypothetical protein
MRRSLAFLLLTTSIAMPHIGVLDDDAIFVDVRTRFLPRKLGQVRFGPLVTAWTELQPSE